MAFDLELRKQRLILIKFLMQSIDYFMILPPLYTQMTIFDHQIKS